MADDRKAMVSEQEVEMRDEAWFTERFHRHIEQLNSVIESADEIDLSERAVLDAQAMRAALLYVTRDDEWRMGDWMYPVDYVFQTDGSAKHKWERIRKQQAPDPLEKLVVDAKS